ncbi:PEP-CTERM protein-sorting domain-containing protein [Anaerohalosphaera lusitana]|uniref:PEP-CTERM protein-sorting domain-containing protein n=1 Tax=Anaerohalosphaera lusitana TaxID=1936003 RepID=A0A1U9NLY3_9BACT|nr:PEP-CTERM sorting domain-containing protein [Anaerohalosphaera lusitana]AQT68744.1 PEP-CTERM protein-sorting domain-containing protein [Anaerohalosphaera lusitana]
MKKLVMIVMMCLAVVSGSSAGLISNGDFSAGPDGSNADNWAKLDGATSEVYYQGGWEGDYPDTQYASGRALSIQAVETYGAQQVLGAVVGQYEVSFAAGYRNDAVTGGDIDLRVSIWDTVSDFELAGETITIADPGLAAGGLSDADWGAFSEKTLSFSFDPSNVSEAALRFVNTSTGSWAQTALIDNVSVTPEPATMMLLGLGALTLRRRRKEK